MTVAADTSVLVAAFHARATLLTLDGRAHLTYAALGVSHELLA